MQRASIRRFSWLEGRSFGRRNASLHSSSSRRCLHRRLRVRLPLTKKIIILVRFLLTHIFHESISSLAAMKLLQSVCFIKGRIEQWQPRRQPQKRQLRSRRRRPRRRSKTNLRQTQNGGLNGVPRSAFALLRLRFRPVFTRRFSSIERQPLPGSSALRGSPRPCSCRSR